MSRHQRTALVLLAIATGLVVATAVAIITVQGVAS